MVVRIAVEAGLSIDHLVTVGKEAHYYQPGGPGFYASVSASQVVTALNGGNARNHQVDLWANLPTDCDIIRTELERHHVSVEHTWAESEVPLLWILNAPEGRRIVATATGASHELEETEFDQDTTATTPHYQQGVYQSMLRSSPSNGLSQPLEGTLVVVDPDQLSIASLGWDYFAGLAATTDVFAPSRVQLSQLSNEDPISVAQELRRRTARSVVARLDHEGSLVLPQEGGIWRVSDSNVTVEDTTGAGDTHAGALTAALSQKQLDLGNHPQLVQATIVATATVAKNLAGLGMTAMPNPLAFTRHELDQIQVERLS